MDELARGAKSAPSSCCGCARAAFNDLRLLRALERAPRALFMPQRYADIACARHRAADRLRPDRAAALDGRRDDRRRSSLDARRHSVLEIGTGTGYATALLAQLAGEVVSVERCQTLALEAAARLQAFGVDNARRAWADGLALEPAHGRFDRILVHGLIEPPAPKLTSLLAEGGRWWRSSPTTARASSASFGWRATASGAVAAELRGPARSFTPLAEGLARAL